ncbi:MAG: 2-dehydropantoate 2-reductase [Gammaproteobacteria bacterium]
MKIVIQGAGALGSIFAAHLVRAGADVTLLARGTRAEQLRTEGITITGLLDATTAVPVETDPSTIQSADLFITTVKTYDTEAALAPLEKANFSSVFSVQNGVLKNAQLEAIFGKAALLGSAANVSGEVLTNGKVLFTQNRGLYIGEPGGELSPRVQEITDLFQASGIETIASDQINTVEWSKFIPWSAVMALSVLTRMETWKFCSHPDSAELAAQMVREAVAVARALNVTVDDKGPIPAASVAAADIAKATELVQAVGAGFKERAPSHRMSTLQDLLHGKRLEVDETLGHLLTLGQRTGVATPASRLAYELVSAINDYQ